MHSSVVYSKGQNTYTQAANPCRVYDILNQRAIHISVRTLKRCKPNNTSGQVDNRELSANSDSYSNLRFYSNTF